MMEQEVPANELGAIAEAAEAAEVEAALLALGGRLKWNADVTADSSDFEEALTPEGDCYRVSLGRTRYVASCVRIVPAAMGLDELYVTRTRAAAKAACAVNAQSIASHLTRFIMTPEHGHPKSLSLSTKKFDKEKTLKMSPENKYLSPTGKYLFQIVAFEMRMSHWVASFTLVEAASGALLLRLSDSNWSLDTAQWLDESRVTLQLRKYPGDHTPPSLTVLVDCQAKMAEVMGQPAIALPNLEQELEELYGQSKPPRSV